MTNAISKIFDKTFWKFILVGVANTLFGTSIMFIFYNCFHFGYWFSSASNYVFGSILSYFLNRIFTFQSTDDARKTLPRFVISISLCYLIAYGLAKPLVYAMLSDLSNQMQGNIAMLVGMGLFVLLNYVSQRFFVFKASETD